MVGCFSGVRAIWPAISILALKLLKNSLPTTAQVNSILGAHKTRLPGLVEAAQARKDVKPPRITCDLRSRNSARLEDRRRASTELKKKSTSAVYKAVLGVEKGHR